MWFIHFETLVTATLFVFSKQYGILIMTCLVIEIFNFEHHLPHQNTISNFTSVKIEIKFESSFYFIRISRMFHICINTILIWTMINDDSRWNEVWMAAYRSDVRIWNVHIIWCKLFEGEVFIIFHKMYNYKNILLKGSRDKKRICTWLKEKIIYRSYLEHEIFILSLKFSIWVEFLVSFHQVPLIMTDPKIFHWRGHHVKKIK